jgi:hypothetical protein
LPVGSEKEKRGQANHQPTAECENPVAHCECVLHVGGRDGARPCRLPSEDAGRKKDSHAVSIPRSCAARRG